MALNFKHWILFFQVSSFKLRRVVIRTSCHDIITPSFKHPQGRQHDIMMLVCFLPIFGSHMRWGWILSTFKWYQMYRPLHFFLLPPSSWAPSSHTIDALRPAAGDYLCNFDFTMIGNEWCSGRQLLAFGFGRQLLIEMQLLVGLCVGSWLCSVVTRWLVIPFWAA